MSFICCQMEHFFAKTPNAGAGEMSRLQALETVKNNIEWMRLNQAEIKTWLEVNVPLWASPKNKREDR